MQYTSKLAILAVALFGTSALAAPYAPYDSELEVREADNELSAREYFDAYLEARQNPYLDARDLAALDLEAREYLEYLEMREVATATTTSDHPVASSNTHSGSSDSKTPSQTPPQTSLSATSPPADEPHPHFDTIQQDRAALKKAANKEFEDPTAYKQDLANPGRHFHKLAVAKYLSDSTNFEAAYTDKTSPYHHAAKHMVRVQKAKAYFAADPANYRKALKSKHHKYHHAAVKKLLSDPKAFENALTNTDAPFHKYAVRKYVSDAQVRKIAIADKSSPYHKAAVKFQKRLDKKHGKKHGKKHSSSPTSTSTPSTATPSTAIPTATNTA